MKPNSFSFNSSDLDKKLPRRKISSRDFPNDTPSDDPDKITPTLAKPLSTFNTSEFGLFFKHKPTHSKSSNGSKSSQMHNKKKSYETSSSNNSTLKRVSSKDYSHMQELYDDTTVISNPPDMRQHPKRASNEMFASKTFAEELTNNSASLAFAERPENKKNMRGVSFSGITTGIKPVKEEDDQDQDIIFGTLSKLGMNADIEEKKFEQTFNKDRKLNYNPEVMERIVNKSFHNRKISGVTPTNSYGISPTTPNYFPSTTTNTQNPQLEVRHNNNSIFSFNGTKKNLRGPIDTNNFPNNIIKKDLPNKFPDAYHNVPNVMINPFESDSVFPGSNLMSRSHTQGSLGQETELLTKSLEYKDFKRGLDTTGKKKQNLATIIPTDSTIDSDKTNYLNIGFSTPFSGTSTSFHNSGKNDFNSPLRGADSGRPRDNLHGHGHMNLMLSQSTSALPIQRNLFNMGPPNPMSLHGSHASGNNTDRSNSFSWNEDFPTNSAMGTPQQPRHQRQSFLNNTLPTISAEPQFVQNGNSQTTRNRVGNNSFLASSLNLNHSVNLDVSNSSIQNQSQSQNQSQTQPQEKNSSSKKQNNSSSKSKKKNQEPKDESNYIIDLNNIDRNTKTTLMVKNIPNKYDLSMILEAFKKNHKGKFDFLYLPIDPRNKCNVGYAFINFIDTRYIRDFYTEFNNQKWERFNSEKICEIKYGRIQGKKNLIHHFQYSNVMNQQDKNLRPYITPEAELLNFPNNNRRIRDLVTRQKLESAGEQ